MAAVLHLLALLPSALEAAGTAAASPSSRAPQLRRLVQQAQQELAPLAAEGAAAAEEGMAAAAEDAGATFFDLSQATPAAVAAAARGLAVLR